MKKSAKLLSLFLVLALAVVGLVIGVSAADEVPEGYTAYSDPYSGIKYLNNDLKDVYYLTYANPADFAADVADDGKLDGTNATKAVKDGDNAPALVIPTKGYVYVLKDGLTRTATVQIAKGTAKAENVVTLNLGNHSASDSVTTQIGTASTTARSYCTLVICNGTLSNSLKSGQYFTIRQGATLTLDSLTFNGTGGASLIQDGGGWINVINSTLTHKNAFSNLRHSWSGNGCNCGKCNSDDPLRVSYVIDNSTISCVAFVNLNISAHVTKNGNTIANAGDMPGLCDVYVKNNSKINASSSTLTFTDATKVLSSLVGTDDGSPGNSDIKVSDVDFHFEAGTRIRVDSTQKVNESKGGIEFFYESAVENDTKTYMLVPSLDSTYKYIVANKDEPSYIIYDKDGKEIAREYYDILARNSIINLTPADGTLKLYKNVKYVENARVYDYEGSITIDLNGFTLYKVATATQNNCRFITPGEGLTVTFKNGNIESYNQNLVYTSDGANSYSGTIRFDNVNIKGNHIFDIRDGRVIVNGGTIDCSNYVAAIGQSSNATRTEQGFELYGTQVSCGKFISYKHPTSDDAYEKATVLEINVAPLQVEGGESIAPVINCNNFVEVSQSTGVSPESTINVNVSGAYVNNRNVLCAGGLITTKDGSEYKASYTFTDTYFNSYSAPTQGDVSFAGQALMSVEGKDGYAYVVAKPTHTAMYANLSLYSDFTLNLYVPVENNVVSINGTTTYLLDEELNPVIVPAGGVDCYVYQVAGIAPTNAAVALAIKFNEGAETRTLNAKYSVVNYAKDYLAGETTAEGEALIKDTLAYVKAATVAYNANLKEGETALDLTAFNELLVNYDRTVTIENPNKTVEGNEYFTGATFDVGTEVTLLVFTLNTDNVTAETKITVNGIDAELVGQQAIIKLRAFMLADEFDIHVDGKYVGTYSLAAYYNSDDVQAVVAQNEIVDNLVKALYAYAESAKAYKAAV